MMSRQAFSLCAAVVLAVADLSALASRATVRLSAEPPEVPEAFRKLGDIRQRVRAQREVQGAVSPEERLAMVARVLELEEFKRATTVRISLSGRFYSARLAALRAGKKIVVTSGELSYLTVVDPADIKEGDDLEEVATSKGVRTHGKLIDVNEPLKIDFYLIESMAVDPVSGCRVGTPGGLEELEYAMFSQMKAVDKQTPVVTMTDKFSIVEGMDIGDVDMLCSKVPADIVITAEGTVQTVGSPEKLAGLDFERLGEARFARSRLLRRMRAKVRDGEMQ